MTTYTVIPKNPSCQAQVVEADEYAWKAEKVVFWRAVGVVASGVPIGGVVREVVIVKEDAILHLAPGGQYKPIHQTVGEFAEDWVAGVVTAKVD